MKSVTFCVVLGIIGNVSSFVISRTRRDMEKTIFDIYGPPTSKAIHHPHHMPPVQPHHDIVRHHEETPQFYIPQGVLDNIFGPPPGKNPGVESTEPQLYSAVSHSGAISKPKEDRDASDFSGSPKSASEAMTAKENSTASNGNDTIDYDNRFLSETLLRTQWLNNREENKKDIEHPVNPHDRSNPEPKGEKSGPAGPERRVLEPGHFDHSHDTVPASPEHVGTVPVDPVVGTVPVSTVSLNDNHGEHKHFKPREDPNPVQHTQHNIISPTPSTNASSKTFVSNSLILVYICLKSLVLI